jgi:dUTP pyrophosphatase
LKLEFYKLRDVKSPQYGTSKAAGLDFFVPNDSKSFYLGPGESTLIPSGLKLKADFFGNNPSSSDNFALVGFNKSGVAIKKNIVIGACVVDSDYAGELFYHVYNYSNNKSVAIEPGEKIVQFVIVPVFNPELKEVLENPWDNEHTERGEGMAGSTGTR